jgi:hypothetical protein
MPKDERPEEEKLAELECSIVEAETNVARQALLVEQLGRDGHSTTKAHTLLNEMTGDMTSMHAHRRHLLRRLQR